MNVVKWRESFSIGVESMDVQHKTIIDLINKLYGEIRSEDSAGTLHTVLEEMTKYAEKHLQEEEALLQEINYPKSEEHLAMHQLYRDKIAIFLEAVRAGDDTAIRNTYVFLRQWWTDHIMIEDKKYGEFIEQ